MPANVTDTAATATLSCVNLDVSADHPRRQRSETRTHICGQVTTDCISHLTFLVVQSVDYRRPEVLMLAGCSEVQCSLCQCPTRGSDDCERIEALF